MESFLLCPVCGMRLSRQEKVFSCVNRHSFDMARRGYVNLLTGTAGATHGDNRAMITARRRFLSRGFYAPLQKAVAARAASLLEKGGVLLDAGCGEGYYTEAIAAACGCRVFGFDISKEALALCGNALKDATLAVASVYHLPFPDGGADLVSCIFAPLALSEYARVLRKDGSLILVIPGPSHLFAMKSMLYETPYLNAPVPYELEGFTLLSKQPIAFPLSLPDQEAIADLFAMTPYAYRTPAAGRTRLASLPSLETEASFEILTYRKA